MLGLLVWLGFASGLGLLWWAAVVITAGLLVWEHSLVHPDDLSKVDVAFFNVNSIIAAVLLAGAIGELLIR
jgi:4-hydroxybenzoate polyprenyltransferase